MKNRKVIWMVEDIPPTAKANAKSMWTKVGEAIEGPVGLELRLSAIPLGGKVYVREDMYALAPKQVARLYLLRATRARDEEGSELWWSKETGWGPLSEAVLFTEEERKRLDGVPELRVPTRDESEWVLFKEDG